MQGEGVAQRLTADLARARAVGGILLEIEEPDGVSAAAQARRRLGFYERWGATGLECLRDYFVVDFADPTCRIPMRLLWRPVNEAEQPRGDVLRAALRAIFDSEYSAVAPGGFLDHLLAQVIC